MEAKRSWSNNLEINLISLVHQYPPLWDTSNKNYPKKQFKRRIYAMIVEKLKRICPDEGLTAESARLKFNRLRTYFQAEWKKRNKEMDLYQTKWIHFDRMLFLVKKEERKNYESCISSTNGIEGIKNHDSDATVPETIYSDSNEKVDSSVSSQLPNKDSEHPLEQIASSSGCDSPNTEIPVILKAWSTSESIERSDTTVPKPSMLSSEVAEPIMKAKRPKTSSPVCDSSNAESPVRLKKSTSSVEGQSTFNVALGNLVVASLNQMPAEKANAATKEIFNVLLKYGFQSNHQR